MNHLPPVLAPYISRCIEEHSLTLLTSVLDTPANWLVVRFLLAASYRPGQNASATTSQVQGAQNAASGAEGKTILVSIWRSLDLWIELARKCNLDLQNAITSGKLHYISGLNLTQPKQNMTSLDSLSLEALRNAINKILTTAHDSQSRTTILLDGLDFLLASQPGISTLEVQQLLLDLQMRAHSVIVTCVADSALLHNTEASATPLEIEQSNLVRSLAHNAQLVFQLRPLETGQSKEVTGSVRVSRGGAWDVEEGSTELEDGEWLYHLSGGGMVKVWGRGEA